MRRKGPFTDAERQVVAQMYADQPTKKIAEKLNRSLTSVYQAARRWGLEKSPEYLDSVQSGRLFKGQRRSIATEFKPGQKAWNAGMKGLQIGGEKTQFKKGNRPQTWVPDGSERITKDGIRQRKVSDTGYTPKDWRSVHSILWEQHHGPIPPGHLVVFKDRDRTNIVIDNLELISRADNARRNSIHNLPPEIKGAIYAVTALKKGINREQKHK